MASANQPVGSIKLNNSLDWKTIDLVVFDVDGTLYDQRRLRASMLRLLIADAWQARSLDTLRVLRTFRHVREALGDHPGGDFMREQYARTAKLHSRSEAEVRMLTSDWLEVRPLPLLAACRYPFVMELFEGLQAAGKKVAAFSDYPAAAKLDALGLRASHVVCATDPDIARLKPDPYGLLAILERTGVKAERALMIGDRVDRDAAAAHRAGVRALIRTEKLHTGIDTFRAYDDAIFQPLLTPLKLRGSPA